MKEKPTRGFVKCNTDGAVNQTIHKAACGGVIRDDTGAWIGEVARNLGSCTVLMAELWGILTTLQMVWDKGYRYVSLESDSAIVVSLINKGCPPSHPYVSIVSLINRLKMKDWQVQISHIYRQANQVADWIANYALCTYGFQYSQSPTSGLCEPYLAGCC
ncbi:hypothetical protein TSUD_273490 [Trifolium subterraneum]|uniref:RNase H type-1 domain-containing protein n=1 Tax=Trifolium subterraneum TaxID=3900 RepID=A0A2Z6LPX5_TRISU|nr:hypothetical protein TSUD_273490 [Trifolium subterraneum]